MERAPPNVALTEHPCPTPVLAREGYSLIAAAAGLALVFSAVGLLLGGWGWSFVALGVVLLALVVWFFRDPVRVPPFDTHDLLLAPADGRVVEIATEFEPLYLEGSSQRVSIHLSPLDVHVNRSPADGVVEFSRYVPGESLMAWHPKASEKNERSEVGLRHSTGTRVLFKQIAGGVARRVVYDARIGTGLRAGERYGIVKFGSRVDVAVPPHVVLDVEAGQRTVAGETILGRIGGPPPGTDGRRLGADDPVFERLLEVS